MALTMSVNTPTKYGSNPLLETAGPNGATWDHDKNYVVVRQKANGSYEAWYAGQQSDYAVKHLCYATSADGLSWTKPDLGIVTYGGNTNNNIMLQTSGGGVMNPGVVYDPDAPSDRRYMFVLESNPDNSGGAHLYKSADGQSLTYVKSLTSAFFSYIEAKEIIKRHDGHWLVYYRYDNNIRKIGCFISKTTDPTGGWADYGPTISATETTAQLYSIGVCRHGDLYFGWVPIFNATTERMWPSLYISRDGLDWTLAQSDWLNIGNAGEWDDEFITNGHELIKEGDDWRFYYSGFATDHGGPLPFDSRIGLATIGYRRIGQIAGTGDFTTTEITPGEGEKLYVNCDASGGGKIEVEVIESGSPKTGYTQTDADDITTDTYETEVTWDSASLPTGAEIKLKFYLDSATLYSYEIK